MPTDHGPELATASRDGMSAFLSRMAIVARPGEGCSTILHALARLTRADWVEGAVRIELEGEHGATRLDVFAEHAGVRERVLPPAAFPIAIDEFLQLVMDAPEIVLPLVARRVHDKLVLSPPHGTVPPPQFEVAEDSMMSERPTVRPLGPLVVPDAAKRSGPVKRFDAE